MPKTRSAETSVGDDSTAEHPDLQTETATEETAPEKNTPRKEDGAAAKARERQERFKALQARAVTDPVDQQP